MVYRFIFCTVLFLIISCSKSGNGIVSTPYYKSSLEYSLKELTNRGLASVTKFAPPGFTFYVANIDIPSREVMNLSHPHCYFKEQMETYCCGENRSLCPLEPRANSRIKPYSYCLVSEIVCSIYLSLSL